MAVNPNRPLLLEKIKKFGIPVCTIESLRDKAYKMVGTPKSIEYEDRIVVIVAYRNNTVIDVIRKVK